MKIAILGCGVAGLSAARELHRNGVDVQLFDKSRGVGGRMSTRYAGDWEFDHGAQFFTAQDLDFRREVESAMEAGVVASWSAKALYLGDGKIGQDAGRYRYVGQPRMNSLPKFWAKGLNVNLGRRVTQIRKKKTWTLAFEDGADAHGFHGVISTLPPAQAAAIVPPHFAKARDISKAQMHACFALMIGLARQVDLDWDSLRVKNLPIDWIAVNSSKSGRSQANGTLVIHSEAQWSDKHVNTDRDWVKAVMLNCASALTELPLQDAPHIALHRWLYASNRVSPDMPCLERDGLVLAGDWCFGGRVQGAWLSGRAAARAFI